MKNYDSEGFNNIIVNVFNLIMEYTLMLFPHAISQLKPKLLLELNVLVHTQVSIPVIFKPILFIPSP